MWMSSPIRVTRLEESMGRAFTAIEALAEKEEKLDDVLVLLTEAQIKTTQHMAELADVQRQLAEQAKRTDQRLAELAAQADRRQAETNRQMAELNRQTDERIEKLVIAIGEYLRRGDRL